jgi:hypothetical protein
MLNKNLDNISIKSQNMILVRKALIFISTHELQSELAKAQGKKFKDRYFIDIHTFFGNKLSILHEELKDYIDPYEIIKKMNPIRDNNQEFSEVYKNKYSHFDSGLTYKYTEEIKEMLKKTIISGKDFYLLNELEVNHDINT